MALPHSLLPGAGSCALHSSGSPDRRAINHPSCVPDFHQIPAFTLCLSCLPAKWHSTLCFISQVCSWVSKLQILWTCMTRNWPDLLGVSCCTLSLASLSQKSSHRTTVQGTLPAKKMAPRLTAFSWCLCSYGREWAECWHCQFFCPWRSHATTPKCSPRRGNCFSLCNPGYPETTLPAPRSLPSFSAKAYQEQSLRWLRLLKLRLYTPLLIITCGSQPLSFSQSMVQGKRFFLCNPCLLLLHSFSLSFLSLQSRFPPLRSTCSSFLPQINSPQPLSSMKWLFFYLWMCSFVFSVLKLSSWVFKMI